MLKNASISLVEDELHKDFSRKETPEQILEKMVVLIEETQNKFTVRKGHQERWEVKALDWMKLPDNQEHLKRLGFVDATPLGSCSVDAICILGAMHQRMADRMRYVETLLTQNKLQAKHLILLSGERYVTLGVDGSEAELMEVARRFKIKNLAQLTEMHLMQDLYKQSSFLKNKYSAPYVMDVKGQVIPSTQTKIRPTTESTIEALIGMLKRRPEIQHVLFVSNQPYVAYQKAIIQLSCKSHNMDHIQIEVIGEKVKDPSKV